MTVYVVVQSKRNDSTEIASWEFEYIWQAINFMQDCIAHTTDSKALYTIKKEEKQWKK